MAVHVERTPAGWRAVDTLGNSGFRVVAIYPDIWPPRGPSSITVEPNWADRSDTWTALDGEGITRDLLFRIGLDDGLYQAVRAAMAAGRREEGDS